MSKFLKVNHLGIIESNLSKIILCDNLEKWAYLPVAEKEKLIYAISISNISIFHDLKIFESLDLSGVSFEAKTYLGLFLAKYAEIAIAEKFIEKIGCNDGDDAFNENVKASIRVLNSRKIG